MVIFGYDKIINGKPITNGFKFENGISPVNLGFAGYSHSNDITDKKLLNQKNTIIHETHFNNLKYFFDIQIQEVAAVNTNEKYFYIIDIFVHEFWINEKAKDLVISKRVADDIRNKKAKILVLFPNESLYNYNEALNLFEYWRNKYYIPENSIILVSGNYFYNNEQNYIPYSIWEHTHKFSYYNNLLVFEELLMAILKKKNRKKIYLNYNRRPKYHRCKMVYNLKINNIFKYGLVSLGKVMNEEKHAKHINEGDIPDSFFNNLPITFDNTNLEINQANSFIKEDYLNTYISIVSETSIVQNDFFPTEKIWKPILMLHPFMVIAAPGFLNMLKQFGYKTFSNWIDERYDNELDLNKRLDLIIIELKKIIKKSDIELKNMLVDMLPILKHNQKQFLKRTLSKDFQKQLEDKLWK